MFNLTVYVNGKRVGSVAAPYLESFIDDLQEEIGCELREKAMVGGKVYLEKVQ